MKVKDRESLLSEIAELQRLLFKIDGSSNKENIWAAYLISYSLSRCWQSLLRFE